MLPFDQLSFWEKETYINHTDFLVIGSGIVGLSTAIHLKERYPTRKVTILERGYLPTGASTKNAGFSCIGSPSELLADLTQSSEEMVFQTVRKRWQGLHYLRELLGDDAIQYRSYGSYELFEEKEAGLFDHCVEKLPYLNEKLLRITGIERVFSEDSMICKTAGFNNFQFAIHHAAEGQINTGMMMHALMSKAHQKGVEILTGISANAIHEGTVETNYGAFPFQQLAICTNGFSNQLISEDVLPARAQVLVTSEIEALPFKGIFHFDEGYYYFRNIGKRILFGGGRNLDLSGEETTKIENTTPITEELAHILRTKILPQHSFEIDHQWAGIMGVGKGKHPIIKQLKPTVFCGIRLGGMGVAIGSLVGKELAEKIIANESH